jgi:hypothetical protein
LSRSRFNYPHWLKCSHDKNGDKYFFEGFNSLIELGEVEDGTYELIGEKVQGNPEKVKGHHYKARKGGFARID